MKINTPVTTRIVTNMNVIFDADNAAIGEMINTNLANAVVLDLNENTDLKNQIKDNAIMHVREVWALRNQIATLNAEYTKTVNIPKN